MDLPLSPSQERMYFLQMADPESRAFNIVFILSFRSEDGQPLPFQPRLLTPALEVILLRNAGLRVTFHQDGSDSNHTLKQRIHPVQDFEVCRIGDVTSTDSERQLKDSIQDEIFKPFDLSSQAFRFVVFHPAPGEIKLCMVFHHLIMDGLSASFLSRDLLRLVSGEQLPELSETPEDHLGRVMLLSRANANEKSGAKQRKLRAWTEVLETAESCASLGVRPDSPRLSADYNECTQEYKRVSKRVMSAMKLLSRSKGVSMTALLSTVFAACVYSYTGMSDVVIGVLSMSRTAESQSTMAYLVNALPLRVNFTHPLSLSDILRRVQRNWSLAREGGVDLQDLLPLVSCLQRKSGAGRSVSASANPLQVMLSYLNLCDFVPEKVTTEDGREFSAEYTELRSGHTHADLYLEVHPWRFRQSGGDFAFCWEYRKAVITSDEVCGLHDLFLRVVESLATGVSLEIALNMKGDGLRPRASLEKRMSLYVGLEEEKQGTSIPNSHLLYLPRFEAKAAEIPSNTAFRHDGEKVSYAQAQQLMTQLAAMLYARGVRSGDHVGIYMRRTHWLYLAVLATLKCAAAYVPIALQNPPERIAKILELSEATLLVTEESLLRKLPGYAGASLCIDTQTIGVTIADKAAALLPTLPEFDYRPDQIFYIIFTSGTTGEPKGIAITQSNLRAFVNVFMSHISPEMSSVTLTSSNISFDAHGLDFLAPLLNGACLEVVDSVLDMREGITFAFASPSAARLIEFPRSMKAVMIGGEAFTLACYENVKRVPVVLNVYGPTECTVYVTKRRVLSSRDVSSIGKVHAGLTAMVLDESMQFVPVGSTGILYIAGAQVSGIGYYKNPEKNEHAFVRNPYDSSETIYNTRDVVRMLPDGSLQFLGRSDDQVKLRGMRFQLLEVENTLISHPKVSAASATVRNPGDSTAQLVAFVTPALDPPSLDNALQRTRSLVPSYMVPSLLLSLEKMPLTKEGKIDRRELGKLPLDSALRTSKQAGDADSEPFLGSAEMSKTATEIASVFAKVLGLEKCSVSADFFGSGGHSLLTFRLVQLVNKQFGCCLNIAHVLQHPTPSALARVVAECRQTIAAAKTGPDSKPTFSPGSRDQSRAVGQMREAAGTSDSPPSSKSQAQPHAEYSPPKVPCSTSSEIVKSQVTVRADSFLDSKEESDGAPGPDCTVPKVSKSEEKVSERSEEMWNFDYLSPVPSVAFSPELSASLELLFESGDANPRHLEELSARLCEESGFKILPAALPRYSSLDSLQSHLKLKTVLAYASTAHSPTVVIHPPRSNTELPVFFVHGGIIGWPFPYIRLAQSLGRHSVAVQRTVAAPTSSFEDMAGYYAEAVRSVQPHGPYTLVGVCFGAQLVYEMSRQLCAAGEHVKSAVMINNSPAIEKLPPAFDDLGRPLPLTPAHPFHFLQRTLRLKLPETITGSSKTVSADYTQEAEVDGLSAAVLEEFPWLPFTATELKQSYHSFLNCLRCVWYRYRPRPTAGIESCVLIRDGRDHPLFLSHDYGLLGLVPPGSLSVLVSPRPLGLLSDKATMEYIGSVLRLYLGAALPSTAIP